MRKPPQVSCGVPRTSFAHAPAMSSWRSLSLASKPPRGAGSPAFAASSISKSPTRSFSAGSVRLPRNTCRPSFPKPWRA